MCTSTKQYVCLTRIALGARCCGGCLLGQPSPRLFNPGARPGCALARAEPAATAPWCLPAADAAVLGGWQCGALCGSLGHTRMWPRSKGLASRGFRAPGLASSVLNEVTRSAQRPALATGTLACLTCAGPPSAALRAQPMQRMMMH